MAGRVGETVNIKCPVEILLSISQAKGGKAKELALLKEITSAICALLNSNGGKVVLHIDIKDIPIQHLPFTQSMSLIRKLEQSMISIIGIHLTAWNINFKEDNGSIIILVKNADTLIITSHNLVEGKVEKMSFATWKRRVLQPVWLRNKEEIPSTVHRIAWNSSATEQRCSDVDEVLMGLINNAQWQLLSNVAKMFEESYPNHLEIQLIVLSKRVITCCRQSYFKKAKRLLSEYNTAMRNVRELLIFGAIASYLQIALARAEQNLDLDIIAEVLSKAELIPPGNISASLLVLAATSSTKGNKQQRNQVSQQALCEKALEHLQKVDKPSAITTDLKRKAHINLANQHLGCSFSQGLVLKDRKEVDLNRAKSSIAVVKQSSEKEGPLTCYREIQFDNVQSILNYRCSQVPNDQSEYQLLVEALDFCRRAKRRAEDCQFNEMIQWTTASECLYTEELMKIRKRMDTGNAKCVQNTVS